MRLLSGRIVLIGAGQHPHAASRLKQSWPNLQWINGEVGDNFPGEVAVVVLATRADMAEGAYSIQITGDRAPKIHIEGGPFSGVIYGVEELIQRGSTSRASSVQLTIDKIERMPTLSYRAFWTWDHSSNWELEQIGHQETGVFNPYGKPPSGFLADYKRMVDFCSAHQIAAIIVYGFLRDSHGGITSAQELCRYANERGVRILPGIAIAAYGGVYWEGSNQYNLATWLRKNPSFASQIHSDIGFQIEDLSFPLAFPRSDYTLSGCPSEPANMAWMEDSVSWLTETFDIGGINMESGDYGICDCARCSTRRGERESAKKRGESPESWSHADLTHNFPRLFQAANSKRSDMWLYCELQWDNLLDPVERDSFQSMPEGGVYQHTLNRSYWNRVKTELTGQHVDSLPTKQNILRCQFASQWNGDERTERYAYNARDFVDMSRKAADVGMKGLTVWGEASPHHVSTELSYLAFGRFSYDPSLTWEVFKVEEVDPRLGGEAAANEFVSILEEMNRNQVLPKKRLTVLRGIASDGIRNTSGEAEGRWIWLAERLNRRVAMAQGEDQ